MNDIESLIRDIQHLVAEKRRKGLYPPGIEEQLDAEFSVLLSVEKLSDYNTILKLKNMILDRLAVVDHLAMMVVELEARMGAIEMSMKSK